jgi:hypothetical protein
VTGRVLRSTVPPEGESLVPSVFAPTTGVGFADGPAGRARLGAAGWCPSFGRAPDSIAADHDGTMHMVVSSNVNTNESLDFCIAIAVSDEANGIGLVGCATSRF